MLVIVSNIVSNVSINHIDITIASNFLHIKISLLWYILSISNFRYTSKFTFRARYEPHCPCGTHDLMYVPFVDLPTTKYLVSKSVAKFCDNRARGRTVHNTLLAVLSCRLLLRRTTSRHCRNQNSRYTHK